MSDPPQVSVKWATASAFTAELVGTFVLTFSGIATLSAIYLLHPTPLPTPILDMAVAIAFGFGILAAVYTVAKISGAHINPAVTLALAATGRFPWREVPAYLVAQFAGGILAGLMTWFMFGDAARKGVMLGATHPGKGVALGTALFTEFVITAILMIVVMATAVFERAPGGAMPAGLSIGLWIGAAIFLALPISGGSLNPARTLGPEVASGKFTDWWIYFAGPICGAAFGAVIWKFLLSKGSAEVVQAIGTSDEAEEQTEQDHAA